MDWVGESTESLKGPLNIPPTTNTWGCVVVTEERSRWRALAHRLTSIWFETETNIKNKMGTACSFPSSLRPFTPKLPSHMKKHFHISSHLCLPPAWSGWVLLQHPLTCFSLLGSHFLTTPCLIFADRVSDQIKQSTTHYSPYVLSRRDGLYKSLFTFTAFGLWCLKLFQCNTPDFALNNKSVTKGFMVHLHKETFSLSPYK